MSEKYSVKFLREECGFSDWDFKVLWKHVRRDLNKPQNIIGLEGPKRHKEAWRDWAEGYVQDSLVLQYFGEDTVQKWKWDVNSEEISAFLLNFLRYAAQVNRTAIRGGREPPTSPVPASVTPASVTPASVTPTAATRKRKAVDISVGRMYSYDSLMNTALDEPRNAPPKKVRRGLPKNEPSPETNDTWLGLEPPSSSSSPPRSLSSSISPSSSTSPSPSPNPEPALTATELPPPAVPHLSQRVFETKLADTNQLRLIYASQTPTLALFLDKVHEKFTLKAHQKVQGINVWTGADFITVDLDEERDWVYIANCVVQDSTRLRVVVKVSI